MNKEITKHMRHISIAKNISIAILCLFTFLISNQIAIASDDTSDEIKKVRVGYCYFEGYNEKGEDGSFRGYGYDFLQKIAPYANLEYEYVGYEKSWSECLQMLEDGQVDMVTPVHFSEEKAQKYSFTDSSIGSSSVILTVNSQDGRFEPGNPKSFDGIKIGSMVGNSCEKGLAEYAAKEGFTYSMVQYPSVEAQMEALVRGQVNAVVTRDLRHLAAHEDMLARFDEEPIYAVTRKDDTELLDRLNDAIAQLDIISPQWRDELYRKNYYFLDDQEDIKLSDAELDYLKKLQRSEPLKVLFNPDRSPYTYVEDGETRGIFFDLFNMAAEELGLNYEIMEVDSTQEYNDVTDAGIPDIIFDCPSSPYVAESKGYYLSESYYEGEFASVHLKSKKDFKTVAVKKGAQNMNSLYTLMYGNKEIIECESLEECIKKVRLGEADCCYMYLYTAANYITDDVRGVLEYTPVNGVFTSFAIATRMGLGPELYSIMNKYAQSVSIETMNMLIEKHRKIENINIKTYIYRNPIEFMGIVSTIITIVVFIVYYWQHKRHEEAREKDKEIRELKAMMDRITDSFPIGIFSYRQDTHEILLVNKETCRLFDIKVGNGELVEDGSLIKNVLPEDMSIIRDAAGRLRNVGDRVEYLFRIIQRDKSIAHILCTTKLLAFEDGSRFILSGIRDYTDRVMDNVRLKQEQAQFRDALIANANFAFSFDVTDGYLREEVITNDGRLLVADIGLKPPASFDALYHVYRHEIKVFDDKSSDCFTCSGLEKMYSEGRNAEINEYYMKTTDRYCQMQVLMYRDAANNHLMATLISSDITETRKDEIRQQQLLKDALLATDRANEAKTEFLSHMSHDIRTPMNAIMGMTAIASTHVEDSAKVKECLNSINTSSKHLLTLINEVLDMSKIEAGKVNLKEEKFKLNGLVDNMLAMTKAQLEEKNHKLSIDIKDVEHDALIGDQGRIQQIFMNLMSNAIKYTPEGGSIRLTITEKESGQPDIGCFEWVFEDNGIGMSEEFVSKVFEPFSREEDSRISKIQGTGLGMAIVKNIVTMMNGTIEVESKLNEGTKFIVNIHLKLQDDSKEKTEENEIFDIQKVNYEGKTALLVEDNELNAEIAMEILTMTGMKVELAVNGQEALDRIVEVPDGYYDIVFMDIQMPIMDGYEASKAIRSLGRAYTDSLPILAMTANAFVDDVEASRAAGMNGHLAKPLDLKLLFESLANYLD